MPPIAEVPDRRGPSAQPAACRKCAGIGRVRGVEIGVRIKPDQPDVAAFRFVAGSNAGQRSDGDGVIAADGYRDRPASTAARTRSARSRQTCAICFWKRRRESPSDSCSRTSTMMFPRRRRRSQGLAAWGQCLPPGPSRDPCPPPGGWLPIHRNTKNGNGPLLHIHRKRMGSRGPGPNMNEMLPVRQVSPAVRPNPSCMFKNRLGLALAMAFLALAARPSLSMRRCSRASSCKRINRGSPLSTSSPRS